MASVEAPAWIAVTVVSSPSAGAVQQVELQLPVGASVRDALVRSGLWTSPDAGPPRVGVWGRLRALEHPLRDRDRVELYRPLQIDPKDARRLRHRQQRRSRR